MLKKKYNNLGRQPNYNNIEFYSNMTNLLRAVCSGIFHLWCAPPIERQLMLLCSLSSLYLWHYYCQLTVLLLIHRHIFGVVFWASALGYLLDGIVLRIIWLLMKQEAYNVTTHLGCTLTLESSSIVCNQRLLQFGVESWTGCDAKTVIWNGGVLP